MKRSQSKDAPSGDPPKGNFLSWNRAGQPRCLRVELADGTFYVFPYQHLAHVKFEPGTDETINITISSHEVKITGKNLRELALAFQKFTIDWVKELQAGTLRCGCQWRGRPYCQHRGHQNSSVAMTGSIFADMRRKFIFFDLQFMPSNRSYVLTYT